MPVSLPRHNTINKSSLILLHIWSRLPSSLFTIILRHAIRNQMWQNVSWILQSLRWWKWRSQVVSTCEITMASLEDREWRFWVLPLFWSTIQSSMIIRRPIHGMHVYVTELEGLPVIKKPKQLRATIATSNPDTWIGVQTSSNHTYQIAS